jgi:hypothetical protein
MNVDPEIGVAVAVDVALDEEMCDSLPDNVQLSGPMMKAVRADEVEGLIAVNVAVGVDPCEVDLVVLAATEVDDPVGRAHQAFLGQVEAEHVGAGTAEQPVLAQAADERIGRDSVA